MIEFSGNLLHAERKTAGTGGIISVAKYASAAESEGHVFEIVGWLKSPIKRKNLQGRTDYFQRYELGFSDQWELAHLWAPRFGDESGAGILWAPVEMNQTYQNHLLESWLDILRSSAAGQVKLRATAISWNSAYLARYYGWSSATLARADFLKRVSYQIIQCPAGMVCPKSHVKLLGCKIILELAPPSPGKVPKVRLPSVELPKS